MANSITNMGDEIALYGNAGDGSIARVATRLKLMLGTSTPNVNGTGFNQVPTGNGYPANGWAITRANWTAITLGGRRAVQLADHLLTVSGGSIANIAGAWIEDASGNVLAWWERPAVTLAPGDTLPIDDLILGGNP
jgi:hypothetical protein